MVTNILPEPHIIWTEKQKKSLSEVQGELWALRNKDYIQGPNNTLLYIFFSWHDQGNWVDYPLNIKV